MQHKLTYSSIEKLRLKLNKLIELYGTQSQEVLKCSQKLDTLIYTSLKTKSK